MEQKTEASQAVDEQAVSVEVYSNAVWLTKGMQTFRLAYTGESDVDRNWYAGQLRAALKAQPAPTEAAQGGKLLELFKLAIGTIAVHDQAEAERIAKMYRSDAVIPASVAAQGEDSARLDAVRIEVDAAAFEAEICDAPNRIITDKTPWGWRYRRAAMQDKFMEFRARASAETGGVK